MKRAGPLVTAAFCLVGAVLLLSLYHAQPSGPLVVTPLPERTTVLATVNSGQTIPLRLKAVESVVPTVTRTPPPFCDPTTDSDRTPAKWYVCVISTPTSTPRTRIYPCPTIVHEMIEGERDEWPEQCVYTDWWPTPTLYPYSGYPDMRERP